MDQKVLEFVNGSKGSETENVKGSGVGDEKESRTRSIKLQCSDFPFEIGQFENAGMSDLFLLVFDLFPKEEGTVSGTGYEHFAG